MGMMRRLERELEGVLEEKVESGRRICKDDF